MGKYEVTQEEYLAVMGNNPSWLMGCHGGARITESTRPPGGDR